MKPRERRETGEQDLFRSRLDQIINMNHELVKLAQDDLVALHRGRDAARSTATAPACRPCRHG